MNLCASSIFKLFLWSIFILTGTKTFSQTSDSLSKKFLVDSISIEGNKKTKQRIILREITFHSGDSLTEHQLRKKCLRWQQNLMNISLFVFDTVYFHIDTLTRKANILVSVRERWYVWPGFIFQVQDRNFNSWWQTKDLFRLNYGVNFIVYNLFGLNQTLVSTVQRGYTEQYGASYRIPYINKKQTLGFTASYNYFRNNQLWYSTKDNALQYYTNYQTYSRIEQEAKVGLTHRQGLYIRQSLDLYYKNSRVLDTITRLNDNYYSLGQTSIQYFSLQYRAAYDYRDYKPYPTKGYVLEGVIIKDGFNMLPTETTDNLAFFASFKNYFKLFHRTFLMYSVKGRYLTRYQPMYYFNRALGFSEVVRGYEYYVIDGQNYALLKSNIRYQIIKPHIIRLPVKTLKKFSTISYALYAGPFVDAGYVQDNYFGKYNPLSNQWLGGAGFGVDLIAYYDLVFRVECSVNRMKQYGIFLHLNAPL